MFAGCRSAGSAWGQNLPLLPEPPPPLSLELPLLEELRSIFLLVSVEWVNLSVFSVSSRFPEMYA